MMDEALVQAIRQDAFADGVAHEQQRIVELLKSGWYSPLGHAGLDTVMLNFIVSKGDDLTPEDIMDFVKEVIALINGEN